jgi:dihydroneopterin aldolase
MTGEIHIQGMKFYGYHGYYPKERLEGGWYLVDVILETDVTGAAQNDDIRGTVNYEQIYRLVETQMQNPVSLIEHLAKRIVDSIQYRFAHLSRLEVTVKKLQPPVGGECEWVSITLKHGTK